MERFGFSTPPAFEGEESVGHRGNFLLVEQGQVLGGSTKNQGFTLDLPGLVAHGEAHVVGWLRRQELRPQPGPDLWDEIFTEAALLANLDRRELILGFWQWLPASPPLLPDVLGCMFTEFVNYPDMWGVFVDIMQPLWPGWQITLALPAEFAVQECILTCIAALKPPLIQDAARPPRSFLSETQKRLGFRLAFSLALGERSEAFRRLNL
ncbi:hypothetical protein Dcar01_00024 [Deinococcus carri]|uniref:Uncharacterized protein n=1 Tax=Deinococcus carri TaxID=1211323 RepID=A0ABP9W1T5_9DEIO